MIRRPVPLAALLLAASLASPARAAELFGGVYAHGVDTPFSKDVGEGGVDLQLGYRLGSILRLTSNAVLQPYAFVQANTRGDTSFAAGGMAVRIGGPLYLRPGIGLAVHTGPSYRVGANGYRTDLGSRIVFEPEIAVGTQIAPRLSLEASWVHISHARLFSDQNPGLDTIGLRLNLHLP